MLFGVLLVCLFAVSSQAADPQPWDYRNFGKDWQQGYCRGRRQSPIALSMSEAVYDARLGDLKFNYDQSAVGYYKNNGHSVSFFLTGNSTKTSKLSGAGLRDEYTLHSLHFHWGITDCTGSEHVIDYSYSPLEVQIVHYSSKFGSFDVAKSKRDGLAIIGILFNVVKGDGKVSSLGQFLEQEYAPLLPQLVEPSANITDKTVNMTKYVEDLAASNKFFRYMGSLATPNCDETVVWTVMASRLNIKASFLPKFRDVKLSATTGPAYVGANYRAIRKLNGRTIWSNDKAAGTAAAATPGRLLLLLLAVAASKFSL